jgi:formylglycine-generating enzyme required for sulfatase activity
MKTKLFRSLAAALLFLAAPAAFAQITVGNVRAAQRAGTKLVDIDYNLTGLATPCKVWLEISADGGTTWTVPATTVSGAVGNNVTPGTDLRITWDAGVDWNRQTSAQTRFRIKADDLVTDPQPEPLGFALIPAGEFQMGDALDGITDAPVHTVNVSAFFMQKKGVTKADWDAVRTWGAANGYTDLAAGAGKAADHPVQTVSWYDAVKWCNARSEKDGLTPCYYTDAAQTAVFKTGTNNIDSAMVKWAANGYRLPTEAEREKAVRGGQAGLRFPWGNTISHANANFNNIGGEAYQTGAGGYDPVWGTGASPYTAPAGSFPANSYGIYDMAGNVWDWCWDWYDAGYYATSPSTDPTGPSGSRRVVRGGSWHIGAGYCRAAWRNDDSPGAPTINHGFRPVRR